MDYAISLSGGIGSGASALIAYEQGLDFEMYFADTLIEDEDLYRFNADISQAVGKPVHTLTDGRTPWGVFEDTKYIGNNRIAKCSDVLKTQQVKAALAGTNAKLILGMYKDEEDRLVRAQDKWYPRLVGSLLIDYKVYPKDADALLIKHGIAKPRLYSYGFPHNNCGGMCVRAGQAQFATLLKHFPERYARHEMSQELSMAWIGETAKPFIRATLYGEKVYLTMKQFREWLEDGTLTVDPYEFGGCGCFVD